MPASPAPLRHLPLALALLLVPLGAAAAPKAGPTVKFVLENGATVADTVRVTARASTDDDSGIEKVDFYIDDQLKATDSSTPYEFDWDTLAEAEGTHTLSATATDA